MRPGHVCPGKLVSWQDAKERTKASMRPGHVCPGNNRARAEPPLPRRFNEAGACLPRKPGR